MIWTFFSVYVSLLILTHKQTLKKADESYQTKYISNVLYKYLVVL
jgi:hypothetical protein